MKSIVLALVAALSFMFVNSSAADAAEGRINSFVDVDEITCYDAVNDTTTVLVYGTSVATLDPPRTDGKGSELILYGMTHGNSCLAPIGSVNEGQGWIWFDDGVTITEETVTLPDEEPSDTLSAPAEQIGTNIVNDYANCRVAPSLDAEVVTVLEPGTTVIEFADGVIDDGWQWVGLEATDCHVSVDLLGEKPAATTVAEPTQVSNDPDVIVGDVTATAEPIVADETVVVEPTPAPAPPIVTGLPSTGTGKIVASNILFFGIVPVGLFVAACIARYKQTKEEKTMKVITR